MKNIIPFTIAAGIAASGYANAQAFSKPSGYITHTIIGTQTAGAPVADTYIAPSLVNPDVYVGAATASPSGNATVALASGVPTDLDGTFVLEVTSGPSEGWWSTVVSSTDTGITVSDSFPAGLDANVTVAVRLHATIKGFFGDNAAGLEEFDPTGTNPNDEVQILDPSTQATTSFAFVPATLTGNEEGSFLNLGTGNLDDGFVIEPGYAVKVRRVGAADLTFTSVGDVKLTDTQVDIFPDFNWVGTPLAASGTLNENNFDSTLVPFTGDGTYDEIQFIAPTQEAAPYAAADLGGGDTQILDLSSGTLDNTVRFDEGSGIIIRRFNSPESIITVPGTTVSTTN